MELGSLQLIDTDELEAQLTVVASLHRATLSPLRRLPLQN